MKIKGGIEPFLGDPEEPFNTLITVLLSKNSRIEFIATLKSTCIPIKCSSMMHLLDWKEVLNAVDDYIEVIVNMWRKEIILTKDCKDLPSNVSSTFTDDMTDLKCLLQFTSSLLQNCIQKDAYNSTEHLVELLHVYDDELLFLVMECLLSLAIPPQRHRSNLETNRHTTAIHKNVAYLEPLFEIVDSCYAVSNIPIQTFLSNNFQSTPELNRIALSSFVKRNKDTNNFISSIVNTEDLKSPQNCYVMANVNDVFDQSMYDILQNTEASKLCFELKFPLMCMVRSRRFLSTLRGRQELIRLQYQAASIILGCHSDSNILNGYFQDKVELIKNFIYLLRSGPGSLEYDPNLLPLSTRLSACQSLEFIIGSRDSTCSPIFVRYPWILYDLGVNRGQYMGLFPCLLRSATSFLVATEGHLDKSTDIVIDSEEYLVVQNRLLWIEQVLILLISLVTCSTALPTLTENGLVSSILILMDHSDILTRSENLIFVEILTLEILECSVSNHSPAMIAFKDKNGLEIIINRLLRELQLCSKLSKIPVANSIIIQEIFSLLSATLLENHSGESATTQQGQWYKNLALVQSFQLIFSHAPLFDSLVLSPAITLLAEMISGDSAPPSILSHMLSSGVVKDALSIVNYVETLDFTSDLCLSVISLMSAVSLTSDGIKVVSEINPFPSIFSLFIQDRYIYPQSRLMMHGLPTDMGTNIEELLRHYPTYLSLCVTELMNVMQSLLEKANEFLGRDENLTFNEKFEQLLHHVLAVLNCFDPLLLKKQTTLEFISQGGVPALLKFIRIALGPPRYLMATLACIVDSTVSSVGFTPLIRTINSIVSHIVELEPKAVFDELIVEITFSLDALSKALFDLKSSDQNSTLSNQYFDESISANSFPLFGLLETVTKQPLQDYCADGILTPYLLQFSKVLRVFANLSYLLEMLGIILHPSSDSQSSSSNGKALRLCINSLGSAEIIKILHKIINDVYIPSQLEMARARGSFINCTKENCVKVHPVYHLLVIAAENVVVKDSFEEISQKVCKLGRGCKVEAYERKSTPGSNILKYRTNDGWISVFRSHMLPEPQVLVLDISKKSETEAERETIFNMEIFEQPDKRSDFEKFANVSARRSGFLAMYHFNNAVKVNLLAALSNNIFIREQSIPEQMSVSEHALNYLSILLNSIEYSSPDLSHFKNTNAFESDFDNFLSSSKSVSFQDNLSIENVESSSSSQSNPLIDWMNKLQSQPIPKLDQFSSSQVFLTIRTTDLSYLTMFENRRGKAELNPLVLLHMLQNEDKNLLDSLLLSTSLVFLCCLPEVELENTDLSEHHYLYDGPWSALKDEELDSLTEVSANAPPPIHPINLINADNKNLSLNAKSTKYKSYLEYRKALKERRLLALSSIDNIIDVWKLVCSALCSPVSSTEKLLQSQVDETHFYDPFSSKRKVMVTMLKYLPQFWNHSKVHLFPPCTCKSIMDLMSVVIKSLNELKSLSNRAPIPSKAAKFVSPEDLPVGFMSSFMRSSRGLGAAQRISSGSSTSAAAAIRNPIASSSSSASSAVEFVVEENTLRSLEDMGFMRRNSMRAAAALRTNNVNQIVEYLFENPYLDDIPVAADPIPAMQNVNTEPTNVVSLNDNANANSSSEVVMESEPPIETTSEVEGNEDVASNNILGQEVSTTSTSEPVTSIPAIPPAVPKVLVLPLKDKVHETELKKEKEVISRILRLFYNRVSFICLSIIEFGPSADFKFLDIDTKTANAAISRELYTVMVLNQMMKCLDRTTFPEGLIKIIQLITFYYRAIEILDQEMSVEKFISLYGVLHSIVVLLTSKTSSGPPSARVTGSNELALLIFTVDRRFNALYTALIQLLNQETKELQSFYKENKNLKVFKSQKAEWIAPALLILDIVSQPMLFDKQVLRDRLFDMHMYLTDHSSMIQTELSIKGFKVNEKIITDTFLKDIKKVFNDTVLKTKQKATFLGDEVLTAESSIHSEEQKLPLWDECLDDGMKIQCIQLSLRLIEVSDESNALFSSSIPQATMQLLAHLTRNPVCRAQFHQHKGVSLILRSKCSFEGFTAAIFTLLQQNLEDERHLTQAIITAIRLCYLRLSKQKTASVLLKNFIEVICPVIYRNQSLFIKTLQYCLNIKRTSGQTFVELKDNINPDILISTLENKELTTHPKQDMISQDYNNSTKKQRANSSGSSFITSSAALAVGNTNNSDSANVEAITTAAAVISASSSIPRKRHFSESNISSASNCDVTSRTNSVYETVDELISLIFLKWIKIKSIGTQDNWSKQDFDDQNNNNSISIADLLMIAADLIASLPSFALCVHRYYINTSKVPAWAHAVLSREYPLKNLISGQPIGNLFVSFVIHALLFPSKLDSKFILPDESPSDIATAIEKISGPAKPLTISPEQTNTHQHTTTIQDACCYFIASLSSRPGEGRKRVLNELLSISMKENPAAIMDQPIGRLEQLHALVRLGEAVQNLLNPPVRWSLRDAFVLPAKDILNTLVKLKAHTKLSNAMCCLDLEHPLSFDVSVLLANSVDFLLRKGLGELNESGNVLKETEKSMKSSVETNNCSVPIVANNSETAPMSDTISSGEIIPEISLVVPGNNNLNLEAPNLLSTTTSLPRCENVEITLTPVIARDHGSSFDLDDTERLLMTNGSEILTSSSQHNHLMLPTGSQQLEDIMEDHSSDEEDDEDHTGRVDHEMEVEGFDEEDHEDDDDDEEDEDMEEIIDEEDDDDDDDENDAPVHRHLDQSDEDDDDDDIDDDANMNDDHELSRDGGIPIMTEYHDDDDDDDDDDDPEDDDDLDEVDSEADYDDEEDDVDEDEEDFEDEDDESHGHMEEDGELLDQPENIVNEDAGEQDDEQMIDADEDDFTILNDPVENSGNIGQEDFEGDDIDPDDVNNDNGTHNDDVDYDEDEVDDGEDALNNENYWMRMGMGIANNAVPGRSPSSGIGRLSSARDFFTRARSHPESRSSRSRNTGADETANPFADMAGFMTEIAGRSIIQGQGFFPSSSNSGSNHRSTGIDLMEPSRRFVFRTNSQDNIVNGSDLSANFQQLISTMLPSNMPISSSTARFDPRTGAVTLSFGRARDTNADNGWEDVPQYTNSSTGRPSATTGPSYVHPLLSITDARRNRFLLPGTSSSTQSVSNNFQMSASTGLPVRSLRSYVSEMRDLSSSNSVLDSTNRQSRNSVSARRRAVGPIVSDRRWGTDMGDLESAGSRLVALTSAVEEVLKNAIEVEPVKESSSSRSRSGSLSNVESLRSKFATLPDPIFNLLNFASAADSDNQGEHMTSPPNLGENNDDSYFEEDDGDVEGDEDDYEEELQYDNQQLEQEESKEEGILQETKEGDIVDTTRTSSQHSSSQQLNTTSSISVSSNEFSFREPYNPIITSETIMDESSDGTNMELVAIPISEPSDQISSEVISEIPVPSDQVSSEVISEENVQFIESLPFDLRQEVLSTAEGDFLRSLPSHIQEEAQQLRDQHALEIQLSSYESQTIAAAPVVNHSAMRLNTVTSLDINTIMDDIRLLSNTTNETTNIVPVFNNTQSEEQNISSETRTSAIALVVPPATASALPTANTINDFTEVLSRLYTASSAALESQSSSEAIANDHQTSTNASAAIETIAIKEAKYAAESAMSISLSEDRLLTILPYNSHLVSRLLICLLSTKKTKLPRTILKLLTTICRYKSGRIWILRAMFSSLIRNGDQVLEFVCEIPNDPEGENTSNLSLALFNSELTHLKEAVMNSNPLNIRKILCAISFLLRKTEKLVWYDIMSRSSAVENSNQIWMFGTLLSLLGTPAYSSSVNLEFILQVLEELCTPLSKLTVQQANELAIASIALINQNKPMNQRYTENKSKVVKTSLDTVYEDESTAELSKRRRLENLDTTVEASTSEVMIEDTELIKSTETSDTNNHSGASNLVRMPFPVLQEFEARILCDIAGSLDCGGVSRKRLMKIMRVLSLCDENWLLFLQHLSTVGADFAAKAAIEFSNLHNTLVEVVQNQETAVAAMSRPELSTPRALSEVRLLNILRLMTVLRARGSVVAVSESETVAQYIRKIQCLKLWDNLFECLDIVRDLEGIKDFEEDEDSVASKPQENESEKKVTLSSLTMRFMPLIECFLTVCSTTLLIRPDNNTSKDNNNVLTSGVKRRFDSEELTSPAFQNKQPGLQPSPFGTATSSSTPGTMVRVHSMIPGSRFRQSVSYFQMQMELSDEMAAARLILFTKQNRILFNQVLRNNIQLLETSFSPLVNVPKCRQLLHFDIKRSYFKMRLKRMRQSSARMHGSLRLSVRRSRVFEESFQSLRYKTADEMRRKLAVNFHGEEGMDAGGLTREWYSVLARDIFNADYALFISSGDNVTFQPNTQSYINEDHLLYFKFVGRVIGKAICDGHLLDAHFTRSFYKHILGLPVSVGDLEAIEPDYYKSLQQILTTPLDQLGLDLTFSAESNEFGQVSTVDLIPQGRDILVTDETKNEYVKLLAHHRMTSAIRKQIDSFLEGFHDLVPPELISIFDAQELELLISGLPDIDLDDLRAHTDYHSYKPTDPEISWFWNVLKSFSKQEKALFLQFVTGTSKVPLDGFQALQGSDGLKRFNIHKSFTGSHQLPSAHTCFNQLDLPQYPSEEVTREKLLIAIREGSEGFGFA